MVCSGKRYPVCPHQVVRSRKDNSLVGTSLPKASDPVELSILKRLALSRRLETYFLRSSRYIVYYTRKLRYFVQFYDFVPIIQDAHGQRIAPSELKEIHLSSQQHASVMLALLNSNLFFWFFTLFSDVRNVNRREIEAFPCSLDAIKEDVADDLQRLRTSLMKDFAANSRELTGNYGQYGILTIQSFQPRLSKSIIDEIDRVLARHYGFTDEELDFIINYDIKYRMGDELEATDENG